MEEASLDVILMAFIMVAALLCNIWSITFSQKLKKTGFYRTTKYTALVYSFVNIFWILTALGARKHGFYLVAAIYSTSLCGELSRLIILFNSTDQDNRIFITSNVLSIFGLLFGTIMAVTYMIGKLDMPQKTFV